MWKYPKNKNIIYNNAQNDTYNFIWSILYQDSLLREYSNLITEKMMKKYDWWLLFFWNDDEH